MAQDMYKRLTAGSMPPERCVEAPFRFLLDRAAKESILGRFDMARYFLDFEQISRRPNPHLGA